MRVKLRSGRTRATTRKRARGRRRRDHAQHQILAPADAGGTNSPPRHRHTHLRPVVVIEEMSICDRLRRFFRQILMNRQEKRRPMGAAVLLRRRKHRSSCRRHLLRHRRCYLAFTPPTDPLRTLSAVHFAAAVLQRRAQATNVKELPSRVRTPPPVRHQVRTAVAGQEPEIAQRGKKR